MESHRKDTSTLSRRHTLASATVKPTNLTIPSPRPKPHHTTSLPAPHTNGAVLSSPSFPPPPLDVSSSSSSLAYTSLKDLLPSTAATSSALNSPTPSGAGGSSYEVPIRNRLVKQAACAYLQPMLSSPDSSPGFLHRLWLRLSSLRNPFSACLHFLTLHVIPAVAGAFRRILRFVRAPVNRNSHSTL